jgi:DNA repair exonuclease SbcCD ATPase subunit
MEIQRCYVENFGVLHRYEYVPQSGFNTIITENGTGKSTFAAFIQAMFYGMPDTRNRKGVESVDRKKYKPWQGGTWGGYIDFSVGEKMYRMERTFADKERGDTFRLIDERTGLDSRDYSENIGMELFGVDKDMFLNTAFVSWKGMRVEVAGSMITRLGNVTGDECLGNFESGISKIDEEYRQYIKTGNRGLIAQLDEEKNELSVQKWNLEKKIRQQKEMLARNMKEKTAKEMESFKLTEEESCQLLFYDDYFGTGVPEEAQLLDKTEELKGRIKELEDELSFGKQRKRFFLIMMGIWFPVMALISFLMWWLIPKQAVIAFMGFAVLVPFCIFIYLLRGSSRLNWVKAELEVEREAYRQKRKELSYAKEYRQLWQKEEMYQQAERKFKQQEEKNAAALIKQEIHHLSQQMSEVNKKLNECTEKKEKYSRRAEVLSKTKKYLLEARNEYTMEYLHGIESVFRSYLSAFDEDLAEKLCLDTQYGIALEEQGIRRDIEYYSSGIRDVLWLCQRLAFLEHLYRKEMPVLVLDDPFIHLDTKMRKKAMGVLQHAAENMQIVYLSCR